MELDTKFNKAAFLTKKAISINENLLEEERKFVVALSEQRDRDYIKSLTDTINLLVRKETLYIQAAQCVINTQNA